jgi:hypothetical protein
VSISKKEFFQFYLEKIVEDLTPEELEEILINMRREYIVLYGESKF